MAELGERLHREIHEKIEKSQREYMIRREQIKLMRRELGEERDNEVELERLGEALAAEGCRMVREKGNQELAVWRSSARRPSTTCCVIILSGSLTCRGASKPKTT